MNARLVWLLQASMLTVGLWSGSATRVAAHASDASAATPRTTAMIRLGGPGPYHQLALPLAAQAGSQREDLGDLRLVNAQGDTLPYAWVPAPAPAIIERQQSLPLFRWDGPRTPTSSGAASMPRHSPSAPSWPLWVVDLRQASGSVHRLHLALPDQSPGLFAVAVESSDNFQDWRTERASAPLGMLSHGGQTLRQETIELDGVRAAYLRLRLLPGSPTPALQQVEVTSSEDRAVAPALSWSSVIRPLRCSDRACDYEVPPHLTLARLKVLLTEANTLLALDVLSQPSVSPAAARRDTDEHRRLRDRLRALLHKERAAPDAQATGQDAAHWQWLTNGQVHWIEGPGAPQRAEELALPPTQHRLLRLSSPQHEAAGWTRRPPSIQVATWSRTVVFLGLGAQPYQLRWADASAGAVDLPMARLMPLTATPASGSQGQALAGSSPSLASLVDTAPAGQRDQTASSAAQPRARAASAAPSSPGTPDTFGDVPTAWWLWGALGIGLALMAWMARSLLVAAPSERQAP